MTPTTGPNDACFHKIATAMTAVAAQGYKIAAGELGVPMPPPEAVTDEVMAMIDCVRGNRGAAPVTWADCRLMLAAGMRRALEILGET